MPLYELEEGTSRKFYRIELHGNRVHLNWGRIGTDGEHQILTHANAAAARAEYQRQLDKRLERGYRLVVDEGKPHDPEALERARLAKTGALSASPRFVFVHRVGRRTAWVEASGTALLVSDGGAPKTTTFATTGEAERERDKVVAKLMSQGYELDTFGKQEAPKKRVKKALAEHPELEHAIAEDPFNAGAWTVLEDWLLQQEDPRGELVRFAKARQRSDEAQAFGAALPLLLGAKHAALQRAISSHLTTWRAGYLVECAYTEPARSADAISASFLAAPATRLVRRLDLEVARPERVAPVLALIAQAPCRHALRQVALAVTHGGAPAVLETRHLAAIRTLDALYVHAPALLGGTTPLPMQKLSVGLATREAAESWCAATFPALRVLHLRLVDRPGMRFTEELAPLYERTMAPALESLVIHMQSAEAAKALAKVVEQSALRPQLRDLAITR